MMLCSKLYYALCWVGLLWWLCGAPKPTPAGGGLSRESWAAAWVSIQQQGNTRKLQTRCIRVGRAAFVSPPVWQSPKSFCVVRVGCFSEHPCGLSL
jgi:hypothetical protein